MAGAGPSTYTIFATEGRSVSRTWHLRSGVEYRGSAIVWQGGTRWWAKKMFYLLLFFYVDGQPIADDGCVMGLSRLSVTCLQRAGRVKYQRRQ